MTMWLSRLLCLCHREGRHCAEGSSPPLPRNARRCCLHCKLCCSDSRLVVSAAHCSQFQAACSMKTRNQTDQSNEKSNWPIKCMLCCNVIGYNLIGQFVFYNRTSSLKLIVPTLGRDWLVTMGTVWLLPWQHCYCVLQIRICFRSSLVLIWEESQPTSDRWAWHGRSGWWWWWNLCPTYV